MIGGGSAVVVVLVVLDGSESERVPAGRGQRGLGGWIMCNQSRNEFLFNHIHGIFFVFDAGFYLFDAGNYRAAMRSVSGDGICMLQCLDDDDGMARSLPVATRARRLARPIYELA
jgi:hypothetical protein